METVDSTALIAITEQSPLLDSVEQNLRTAGQALQADTLVKLQQDVGLELDPMFDPEEPTTPPGPISASLQAAYQPVTVERLAQLHPLLALITDATLKAEFKTFVQTIAPTPPATIATTTNTQTSKP